MFGYVYIQETEYREEKFAISVIRVTFMKGLSLAESYIDIILY